MFVWWYSLFVLYFEKQRYVTKKGKVQKRRYVEPSLDFLRHCMYTRMYLYM